MHKPTYFFYLAKRTKESKPFFAVILLFAMFCIASFIYFLVIGQIRDSIMALVFTLFIPLIFLLERWLKLQFVTPFIACVLFIAIGSILGAGYNLYTIVPFFDTILHCISGFIFACLGFALLQLFIGKAENKRTFGACLLFGFVFSLAIAVLWELFEYFGTAALGLDMQEDTIVHSFNSYLLSGTHSKTFDVEGITQTIIYFGNGKTLTLDGYLDLGLIDTIADMAICLFGSIIYLVTISIDWCKKKVLFRAFIPKLMTEEKSVSQDMPSLAGELCDVTDNE